MPDEDEKEKAKEYPVPSGLNGRMRSAAMEFYQSPPASLANENAPGVHWVAAESLEAALRYMRQRYDDFNITEARFLDMIPLLSGSPLD